MLTNFIARESMAQIAYAEYNLRTATTTKITPIVKGEDFDGLEISVDGELVIVVSVSGRIKTVRPISNPGTAINLQVVNTVSSVFNLTEDYVQSFVEGFVMLCLNGGSGSLQCPADRLLQMDRVLLGLITQNPHWEPTLRPDGINLAVSAIQ